MGVYNYKCLKCDSNRLGFDEKESKVGYPCFVCYACGHKEQQEFKGGYYRDGERRELARRFPLDV